MTKTTQPKAHRAKHQPRGVANAAMAAPEARRGEGTARGRRGAVETVDLEAARETWDRFRDHAAKARLHQIQGDALDKRTEQELEDGARAAPEVVSEYKASCRESAAADKEYKLFQTQAGIPDEVDPSAMLARAAWTIRREEIRRQAVPALDELRKLFEETREAARKLRDILGGARVLPPREGETGVRHRLPKVEDADLLSAHSPYETPWVPERRLTCHEVIEFLDHAIASADSTIGKAPRPDGRPTELGSVFVAGLHAAGVPDEVSDEILTGGIRKRFLEKLTGLGLSKETATKIYGEKFCAGATAADMSTKQEMEARNFLAHKCVLDKSTVDNVLRALEHTRKMLAAKRGSLGKSRSRSPK